MSCQMFPVFLVVVVCLLVNVTNGSGTWKLARPEKDIKVTVEKQSVNFACPEISIPHCPELKCPEIKLPLMPACPACPNCPGIKCPDIECPDPSTWLKLLIRPESQTTPRPQVTDTTIKCPETITCPEPKTTPQPITSPEPTASQTPGLEILTNVFDDDGWIVFQRRMNGEVDFYRGWQDYKVGFGDFGGGDFWLGNDVIHQLSSRGNWEMRVEIAFKGTDYYAEYSTFSVAGEEDNYRLTVGGYSGTVGDGLMGQNGMGFSTFDRDNDKYSDGNCAELYHGAWWYRNYYHFVSNLNGVWGSQEYNKGVNWISTTALGISASFSTMMMRPVT